MGIINIIGKANKRFFFLSFHRQKQKQNFPVFLAKTVHKNITFSYTLTTNTILYFTIAIIFESIRVLAFSNANAKYKENLAFATPKCSKMLYIRELQTQKLQIFLQYCYSAILHVELHCSSIVKIKTLFYSFSLICSDSPTLSPLSSSSLSLSPSPFPLSQCYLLRWVRCGFDGFAPMWVWFTPIGVSWVKWWIDMVGHGLWVMGFGFGLIWV